MSKHFSEGGKGVTNFELKRERVYIDAICEYRRQGGIHLYISEPFGGHVTTSTHMGLYDSNRGRYSLSPFWRIFEDIDKKGKQMKKELKKPVAHYETMIKWVEGRGDLHENPDMKEMERAIEEHWEAEYCSYCKKHDGFCAPCELGKVERCSEGSWSGMKKANTWASWLTHAYKLLDVLREIEKEEAKRKSEVTYKAGDRFSTNSSICGGDFILCRIGGEKISLFDLEDGNRWNDGVKAGDDQKITQRELNKLMGAYKESFTLIEEK